jgi:hypothetical protein
MSHPFLIVNRELLAKEPPADCSLRRLESLLEEEEKRYSSDREPNLVGGRAGMDSEIKHCRKQLEDCYRGRPKGNSRMYMEGKVILAVCHGRVSRTH